MNFFFFDMRYFPFLTRVWRHIVQNGDILVDATCGNGYDTLAMVKMVADKSSTGRVYAMDIQKAALESTSSLLDESLDSDEVLLLFISLLLNLQGSSIEFVINNSVVSISAVGVWLPLGCKVYDRSEILFN